MTFFLLLLGALSFADSSHLSREWAQSTYISPNYGFRHLNLMSPLLTDDYVIQANSFDGLKVFRRNSGAEVWSFSAKNGSEGVSTDGESVFLGAGDGNLYSLDLHSGKVLWEKDLKSESLTSPLVIGGRLYHITGNSTLYALDKENGETLWAKTNANKSDLTIRGQTTPVVDDGILYIGYSDGNFVALNAENGRELWSKRIGDDKKFNDVDATPVVTDRCVLVSSFANALYCLDKSNGAVVWRHEPGGYHSVTADEGTIYYSTLKGEIHLLELKSGKLLKTITDIRGLPSQVRTLDNYMIYGESQGALVIRDKKTLKVRHRFFPGRGVFTAPAVSSQGRQIYMVSRDANIYRLDMKSRPNNPWLEW